MAAGQAARATAPAARIELEKAHGTFWWPLGLAAGGAILAGIATLRGHRVLGGALAAAIGAAALDDLPPGERRFRRLLPQKTATTVVTEMGPADAKRTVVLVAHHDAAHSGLIYHPAIPELVFGRAPWLLERSDTSPPLMAPAVAIPALIGAGALSGNRALRQDGNGGRGGVGRPARGHRLARDGAGCQRQRHRRRAAGGDGAGAGGAADARTFA